MKRKGLLYTCVACLVALGACSPSSEPSATQPQEKAYQPKVTFAQAVSQNDAKAVQYYLEQGETPNQLDENGTPFLILAVQQDNADVAKQLLDAEAFLDTTNAQGETALWVAVHNGNDEITEMLLEAGANPDTANQDNITALMDASEQGFILNVEQLLNKGADVAAKNNQNKTALDLAKEQHAQAQTQDRSEDVATYDEIISMLTEASKPIIPAAVNAIATSNADAFAILAPRIKTLKPEQQARLLWMASQVCIPNIKQICHVQDGYRATEFPCVKKDLVCDQEANAQIIRTLVENGAPSTGFTLIEEPEDTSLWTLLNSSMTSVSSNLQQANPELLVELMPKLDTCMLALTQISQPDPSDKDDGLYQAYWLQNSCSLDKMHLLGVLFYENARRPDKNRPYVNVLDSVWKKDMKELFELLGQSKENLLSKRGEPNFKQQVSGSREVLSYRKSYPINTYYHESKTIAISDDVYTIDHGMVTQWEYKSVAYGLRPYVDRAKIAKFEQERGY